MEILRHSMAATSAHARRVVGRTVCQASSRSLGGLVREGLWRCAPADGQPGAAPLIGASGQAYDLRLITDLDADTLAVGALLVRAPNNNALAMTIAALRAHLPGATIIGIVPDALAIDVLGPLRAGADDVFGTEMMTAEALARIEAITRRRGVARRADGPRESAQRVEWRPTLVG